MDGFCACFGNNPWMTERDNNCVHEAKGCSNFDPQNQISKLIFVPNFNKILKSDFELCAMTVQDQLIPESEWTFEKPQLYR